MSVETPNILVTVAAFLLLIGTLVIVHELGHYWVARLFRVKVDKFSIGFGPQIWGRVDRNGTLWRVAAFPLGGYVQFAGDMNPVSQPDSGWEHLTPAERSGIFQAKPLWQRALIVFAGPAINFLFAIMVITGFLLSYGQSVTPPVIASIQPDSPAAMAGLQVGDRILSFNNRKIDSFDELVNETVMIPNEEVEIIVDRNGQEISRTFETALREEVDRFGNHYRLGMIGVGSPTPESRPVSVFTAPFIATARTFDILGKQIQGIGQIISGRRSVKEIGGPLKIAKISGEAMTVGLLGFLSLAAIISINLGFMNLLPIPMLDGGHLLLYGVEAIRRRPATAAVQEWAFRAGFAMLVGFMLMVTFNDLASFGLFGG